MIRRDISNCPSCSQEHLRLRFKKAKKHTTATHSAKCPTTNDNIYITNEMVNVHEMDPETRRDTILEYKRGHGIIVIPFL